MKDGLQIDDGINFSPEVLLHHLSAGFSPQISVSEAEAKGGQNIEILLQLAY
jgi:hypothetical protein